MDRDFIINTAKDYDINVDVVKKNTIINILIKGYSILN